MASPLRPANHAPGILIYLVGVFFFALNDALGKWLVVDYSVGELMLLRNIGAGFVLIPAILMLRAPVANPAHFWLQAARVLVMTGDTFCFYYATRTMPLADVITFYMASPLIVTALSAPLLGERVEPFRWIAVGAGFIGVLIALQPSAALLSSASPIALVGSVMFGLSQIATRRLRDLHWLQLTGWQFAGAGLIGAATLPWSWKTPGAFDLGLMFLVGIVSMACFVAIARALALAPAAVVAPFQYTSIVWATAMGWLVWRDAPTPPIVLGAAIIIASGLFLFYREVRSPVSTQAA